MTIDPEDLNEEANALHVEQVVSMDAGLFEVFDDDDVDEECVGDVPIDYDALSFDGGSFGEILETAESKAMSIADDEKPASVSVIKPKKKRQSLKIEHADRGLPPPRWHSEAADKFHRKAIQMEIAKLLQMRKTSPPSETWLQQLPHKVRKLEERLYRSAPSLESYLDRKSLKARLKTVAKAITQQYEEGKMRRASLESLRSSVSSLTSFGNMSNRESIASIGSMESIPTPVGSSFDSESTSRRSMSQSSPPMSFTQQPAGSTVGDVRRSQPFHNQDQPATENKWQSNSFPSGMPLPRPLSLPVVNTSHNAMGIPQNSQGTFVNPNNMLHAPIIPNNNTGMLNQGGVLNSTALFGQPMNMLMLNSANTAQMNSALNAMQLQQRQMQHNQMQYALNTQQTQMLQQRNPGMMGGNTPFGLSTHQNSMSPPYFMPNVAADANMPPPPSLYQGAAVSPSATASMGSAKAPSRKGAGKKK